MQRVQGTVISVGVLMIVDQKIVGSYFSDRLTFLNIHGRTSRQIYRLALPLCAPEMLSSLNKIFLHNVHLALFLRRTTQLRSHSSVSIII